MKNSRLTPKQLRRVIVQVLAGVVAAAAAIALIGLPFYVFPTVDQPERADAIVVLGPPKATRIALAEKLVSEGYAETILISVPPTSRFSASSLPACTYPPAGADVTCFLADPFTTQGEARFVRAQAQENGWNKVLVITSTPHVYRARLIFDRCIDGALFVADPRNLSLGDWIYQYLYQTGAMLKASVNDEC
ncbi:YdcF family protein [Herbiconiux sp. CPCC 205763]|uniref:YdcF family protein n=1 Tax=Herbiconiux aconitum TaxID=2970913 RepID=A0ABT2GKL1_9MICO|nr:YdcF family protein [Herbiconiux aconitum]MCS5716755.1 YdcF family protein [Herbiconiux aconitum]